MAHRRDWQGVPAALSSTATQTSTSSTCLLRNEENQSGFCPFEPILVGAPDCVAVPFQFRTQSYVLTCLELGLIRHRNPGRGLEVTIDVRRRERRLLEMSCRPWGSGKGLLRRCFVSWGAAQVCEQQYDILPRMIDEQLWFRHQQDGAGFVAGWRKLAEDMRQGLNQLIRQPAS
jgi:hypothetical protein